MMFGPEAALWTVEVQPQSQAFTAQEIRSRVIRWIWFGNALQLWLGAKPRAIFEQDANLDG